MRKSAKHRTAHLKDFRFVTHLARRFTEQLGFIPNEALNTRIARQEVELVLENDTPAGYILSPRQLATAPTIRPIFQAAVCMDAQRRHLGLSLIERVAAQATRDGKQFVQAFVRSDLDANEFFEAAGFRAIAIRTSSTARRKPCLLWRRQLVPQPIHSIFYLPPTSRVMAPGGRFMARSDVHTQPILIPLRRRRVTADVLDSLVNGRLFDDVAS